MMLHLVRPGMLSAALAISAAAWLGSGGAAAQGMVLDICPTDYGSFPEDAPSLACGCAVEAVRAGSVWGTNPYYYQSSLCRAALHAGAIGAGGGEIVVVPARQPFFPAVAKNGVEASSWGDGMGFRVVTAGATPAPETPAAEAPGAAAPEAPAAGAPAAAGAPQQAGMRLDVCPTDYGSFPDDAPTLTCGCSAEAVKEGTVWGANPYYYQSSLCRAAVQAGAIGAGGGEIVVEPARQPFFPAVARNGVEANSWGDGAGFRVVAQGGESFEAAARGGLRLDICPIDYGSFPEDAPPLTCGCSAEAVKEGSVWGANPYYYQSSLCRAALQAGAVAAAGGEILVEPARQPFFPAISRNGVEASSWGDGMGFRVSAAAGSTPIAAEPVAAAPAPAAPAPAVDAAGQPVQAPIAETLRQTGKVQLYINFATAQAEPLPSSEPVLQELLAALQADPSLKIELIGHTDSQGSAPYNLDLSQRRAAAIYLWLIQHAVESGRLRSDGRGLLEPIADNSTVEGRALNRRVEAKAVK